LWQIEVMREDVARINRIAVALVIIAVTRIVSLAGIVEHGGYPPSNNGVLGSAIRGEHSPEPSG